MVLGNDFEMGKRMLVESLRTMLNLYANFYIGLSLLGLDLPTMDDSFKMNVEQAKLSKIGIDTLINSVEKAQSADEVRVALFENDWLVRLLGRQDSG